MSTPSYAAREDVFGMGVPRGALIRKARLIASVDIGANALELAGHGLKDDDAIQFTADAGGELPTPLALLTPYFAKLIDVGGENDENRFQVSATLGGSAVDLSDEGTAPFRVAVPLGPTIDRYLAQFSRWADRKCIAHKVPFEEPYPDEIVYIVRLRTTLQVIADLNLGGFAHLAGRERDAIADFLAFAATPLRDERATASTNRAVSGSSRSSADRTDTIP